MDVVSHLLIGAAIGELDEERPRRRNVVWWAALFGVLPDVFSNFFLYPYVGWLNGRPWFIPLNSDWDGFRGAHPVASAIWDCSHSFLFLLIVVIPVVRFLELPRACIWAWTSHLFLDVFTHSGEWTSVPLWPIPWGIEGFTDAWAWPPSALLIAVIVSFLLWQFVRIRVGPKWHEWRDGLPVEYDHESE